MVKHGTDEQTIRDLPCHGKQVIIAIERLRYRCKTCRKTWFEDLPEIDEHRSATLRLIRYLQQQSLARPFVQLAAECGLDEKSVRTIFHDHVGELERTVHVPTPVIMGMDELYLLGQPRGMITDVKERRFVEILSDRKKQTIIRYLMNLEHKEQVQVCVIDMWRPYLEALQEALPHVKIVIDKWHVLKQLNEVVETTRKELRAGLNDRQRREMMHDRFLLLKRNRDLTERERLILEAWLGSFPFLKAIYERKEEFYVIYDAHTEEEAWDQYMAWFDRVVSSGVFDAFLDFTLTIERWGEFIFNYFAYRYTGSFVEGANSLARSVDRQGRGYSLVVLRARLLYGQHLLRQTKRRGTKARDLLQTKNVDGWLVDALPSTQEAMPSVSSHQA